MEKLMSKKEIVCNMQKSVNYIRSSILVQEKGRTKLLLVEEPEAQLVPGYTEYSSQKLLNIISNLFLQQIHNLAWIS